MSECVVSMEMPTSCEECHLVQTYENDWGDVMSRTCNLIYKGYLSDVPKGERRADCPIICQLPEGHGRLMDKDEVIESIRTEVTELFFNGLKGTPRPDGDLRFMWNRLEDEDFAPTIVPAEAERSET